jgi:hypothetical protein
MQLGQVTTAIEFKTTNFTETVFNTNHYELSDHLNEMGKEGWFLHSLIHHSHYDGDGYLTSTDYRCIWQKITQNVSGLLK